MKKRKPRKPRSLKQDLIWKSGGMLGHFRCGKTNLNAAELNARRILAAIWDKVEDLDELKDLQFLRSEVTEICLDLDATLSRFNQVLHDVDSAVQAYINKLPPAPLTSK